MSATEATVAFDATGGGSGPAGEDEVSVKAFGGGVEGFGRFDTCPWIRDWHR